MRASPEISDISKRAEKAVKLVLKEIKYYHITFLLVCLVANPRRADNNLQIKIFVCDILTIVSSGPTPASNHGDHPMVYNTLNFPINVWLALFKW